MEYKYKTREQLIKELIELRKRITELERSENERKEANEAMKESEKKYSTLVEKGNDGIIIIQDNLLKFVNSKMIEITGFSIEEALEKPFIEFVSPKHRELVMDRYKKRLSGEKIPNKYEIEILSKDNRKIPVEINGSLIEYGGRPADMAIIRDIIARKRAEMEIRQRTEDIDLTNSLNYAVNRGDTLEDVIKLLADNTKKMFSCYGATVYLPCEDGKSLKLQNLTLPTPILNKIENLIGMKIPEMRIPLKEGSIYLEVLQSGRPHLISDPEKIQRFIMEFAETFRLPKPLHLTIRNSLPHIYNILGIQSLMIIPLISDGKVIGLMDVSHTRQFKESDLKRFETIAWQLTASIKRKQAEEALRESEEKFRQFFENEPEYCYMVSPDGIIQDMNESALRALGYKRDEIVGKPLETIYAPELLPKMKDNLRKWKKDGKLKDAEMVIITKKGDRRTVILSADSIRDKNGKILYSVSVQKDITRRKKAEDALQAVNERLNYLLASTSTAIYTSKTSGDYGATEITENVKQLTGYEPREFIDDSSFWINHVHPEDRQRVLSEVPLVFDLGKHIYEYRFLHKDGTYRWLRDEMNLVRDESGNPVEIVGCWIDITERIKAEELIKESEEKFRNLAEQSPNMIFINKMGRVAYANKRCEEILGYEREEFYSPDFNFLVLIAPEYIDTLKEKFGRHKMDEEVLPYEYALLTKDGKRIESIINTKLINYEGSRAILGVITDITERKQAEESLRESEEKFRNLAEQSPNMIFIIKGKGIVYANKKCEEITGYKRENFYMKNFNFISLTLPEHAELIQTNLRRNFEGEDVSPFEFTIIGKKGNKIDVILASKLIKYGGETAVLGIITDITKRKEAEEKLKRTADDLARSHADIETFVYSVAHDLRGPLRAMRGFSEALIEDYADKMDSTAMDYTRRISNASRRMDNMIQDLLSYSRVSRAEMELGPANFENILDDVIEQMDSEIKEKKADVYVKKPLPAVVGNRDILPHVIRNLISNALKFVSPGVKPAVKIWSEDCDYDNLVRIWVEDNGIGIAPEYRERIFRVFERLHSTEEYTGTGIGLAIVRKGVERMGGCAGVESEPGRGSKFWIELQKAGEKSGVRN